MRVLTGLLTMNGEARTNAMEQNPAECDVYRNAFAAPSIPRSRPWERASVSAHAPRLHGHKIWKRIPPKSKHNGNKENDITSQLELEKEGVGARKRARHCGRREHISEAPWQQLRDVIDVTAQEYKDTTSPNKQGSKPRAIGGDSPDKLRVVPRKRTNANHLITPKRPSQRLPLKDLTQRAEETPRMSPQKLSPMALIESGGSPSKVPLNEVGASDSANKIMPESSKKSTRRRSLRQSTRRLTTTEAVVPSLDSAKPLEVSTFAPEITSSSENQKEAEIQQSQTSIEYNTSGIALPLTEENTNEHALSSEPPVTSPQPHKDAVEGGPLIRHPSQPRDEFESLPAGTLQIDILGSALLQEPTTDALNEQAPLIVAESTPLRSLTMAANVELSPTKASNTPNSRKRIDSKFRGSRRSARSTRGSLQAPDAYLPEIKQSEQISVTETAKNLRGAELREPPTLALQNDQTACSSEETQDTNAAVTNEPVEEQLEPDEKRISEVVSTETTLQHSAPSPRRGEGLSPLAFVTRPLGRTRNLINEAEMPRAVLESQDSGLYSTGASVEDKGITAETGVAIVALLSFNGDTDNEDALDSGVLPEEVKPDDDDAELEVIEPISMATISSTLLDNTVTESEDLHESSTPDPSTTELVEAISENALPTTYDHDDTDLLRDFLSRVKANKEAKAKSTSKRKRSFPHSPLRLPLGEDATYTSPTPTLRDEFDVSFPSLSPTKTPGRRNETPGDDEDLTEPRSVRRSGRTRLPVKASAPVPSFIPVRRLGQDGDNTLSFKRNEEKELAALTRVNTRKNKAGGVHPQVVLAKLEIEKLDPAARQRALKERFDEKSQGAKSKKEKRVVWAEEIAQYQSAEGEKKDIPEKENEKPLGDEKKGAVRVGVRSSRISLGMAMNGTPAPKRKVKARP